MFPPGSIIPITREGLPAVSVAVYGDNIFWWSAQFERIERVSKQDPQHVVPVLDRKGQTVTALAADASGVYWIEAGADDEATSANRIMRLSAATNALPEILFRSPTQSFKLLTLNANRVARRG